MRRGSHRDQIFFAVDETVLYLEQRTLSDEGGPLQLYVCSHLNFITIHTFFWAQGRNRKELEKVQNEVDRVLNGRTATFDDVQNLPKCKNAITVAFFIYLLFSLILLFLSYILKCLVNRNLSTTPCWVPYIEFTMI